MKKLTKLLCIAMTLLLATTAVAVTGDGTGTAPKASEDLSLLNVVCQIFMVCPSGPDSNDAAVTGNIASDGDVEESTGASTGNVTGDGTGT